MINIKVIHVEDEMTDLGYTCNKVVNYGNNRISMSIFLQDKKEPIEIEIKNSNGNIGLLRCCLIYYIKDVVRINVCISNNLWKDEETLHLIRNYLNIPTELIPSRIIDISIIVMK